MKEKGKANKILLAVLTAVCIAALVISLALALRIYLPQKKGENRVEDLGQIAAAATDAAQSDTEKAQASFAALKKLNSDYAGWLHIEGTKIDYPVMQPPQGDSEYYLRRDFDKKDAQAGSLFLGEGCTTDSRAVIIYGHNMQTETMFGSLDSYKSFSFAKDHPEIELTTGSGKRVYRVFAAFQTQLGSGAFAYDEVTGDISEPAYNEAVQRLREMSDIALNEQPAYPAQLLLLSTCSYHTEDGRFVVAAYLR
ncbi:MAG: class B sortase [Clostridia bacterium]|nr:class B sortase [Clostridia bacterium]